jgi:hypothetical protein
MQSSSSPAHGVGGAPRRCRPCAARCAARRAAPTRPPARGRAWRTRRTRPPSAAARGSPAAALGPGRCSRPPSPPAAPAPRRAHRRRLRGLLTAPTWASARDGLSPHGRPLSHLHDVLAVRAVELPPLEKSSEQRRRLPELALVAQVCTQPLDGRHHLVLLRRSVCRLCNCCCCCYCGLFNWGGRGGHRGFLCTRARPNTLVSAGCLQRCLPEATQR